VEKLKGLCWAVAALAALAPAQARDFPLEWHWVRVGPNGGNKAWDIQQSAKAEVTFTRGGFVAKLYDDADPASGDQPDIILQGHIDGKHASAVETLPDTDAGHRTLHGIIARPRANPRQAAFGGMGEDRISLYAGHEFIGISRMVRSGAPPGK
jgi:hypothetical protein